MKIYLGIIFLLGTFLTQAENLIKNNNFSELSPLGTPTFWEYRGQNPKGLSIKDGIVKLDATKGKDRLFLIQQNLAVKHGQTYTFTYQAKGKGKFRIYIQWKKRGGKFGGFFNTQWYNAADEWATINFTFKYPSEAAKCDLVINCAVNSKVSFKALELAKSKPSDFASIWNLNTNSRFIKKLGKQMPLVHYLNDYQPGAYIDNLKVEAGNNYRMSFNIIGLGNPGNNSGFHQFKVAVQLGKEKIVFPWDDVWTTSFANKKIVFTVPKNYRGKTAKVEFYSRKSSSLLYDDFKLEKHAVKAEKKYHLIISSPAYRNGIYQSKMVKNIAGYILADDQKIKSIKVSLFKDGEKIYSKKINALKFNIPDAAKLAIGKYDIEVDLFNSKDRKVISLKDEITKYPKAKVEVIAGQDNNIYINGKAFFPVSPWHLFPHPAEDTAKIRKYLAANGFNAFISTAKTREQLQKELDDALKGGYMIIYPTWASSNDSGKAVSLWLHNLCRVLGPDILKHEALMAYFLRDEPAWKGVPQKYLLASYQALKKFDPYRPVWINAAPRGSLDVHKDYSKAADIYGIDIYPVPRGSHTNLDDKELTCVGKYTERCVKSVLGKKPIWMILQGFSWGNISIPVSNRPYPDLRQSRFMLYDSILNGATGINYYGFLHVLHPDFFDIILAVTKEVNKMSTILVKGKVISDKTEGAIRSRLIKYGDEFYLISMNITPKAVSAKLNYKEFKNKKILVLFENRKVESLKSEFAPFDVHIYATGKLPEALTKLPVYNQKDDPLKGGLRKFLAKQYKGKAFWIWDKKQVNTPGSRVFLAKIFDIKKEVLEAELIATADNFAELYLDGHKLGITNTDWKTAKTINLTNKLTPGKHIIFVKAEDGGGLPCGFLADLTIIYKGGGKENIVSDSSWFSSGKKQADMYDIESIKQWSKAHQICPYGEGRWENRLQLPW